MQRQDVGSASQAALRLEVRGLVVGDQRMPAVRGLDLRVPRGQIVALLGDKRSGTSITLAAVAGAIRPRSGEVLLDGFPITGAPPRDLARRGLVAILPGMDFPDLTVAENLRLGAYWRRSDPEVRADILASYARFPALAEHAAARAITLDAGEQRDLTIARALLARPRLLLVDQPFTGLDTVTTRQVIATLGALREEGLTVLIAEQSATAALAVADRAYVLEEGVVALSGAPPVLIGDGRYRDLALGGHPRA